MSVCDDFMDFEADGSGKPGPVRIVVGYCSQERAGYSSRIAKPVASPAEWCL